MRAILFVPLAVGLLLVPTARAANPGVSDPALPGEPSAPVVREHAHLLIVVEIDAHAARVSYARRVDQPLPRAKKGRWQVEVIDASGRVAHRAPLRDPGVVRGEFHGEGGSWERVEMRKSTVAFSLRVPLIEGATRIRVLAPAAALPAGDARAAGAEPGALVEVGSFAVPVVER